MPRHSAHRGVRRPVRLAAGTVGWLLAAAFVAGWFAALLPQAVLR
ncbi:hypothetical protein [Streptomyces mayteni]